MHVGQIIENILQSINISKTKFAKDIHISKSYLIRVIHGEKNCSEALFKKIIGSSLIPPKEKELLADEFYSNLYGTDTYSKIKFIINKLNHFRIVNPNQYFVRSNVFDSIFNATQTPFIIGSRDEFLEIVHYFLSKSCKNENFYMYTNYSFEQTKLNDFLLKFFKDIGPEKNVNMDFIHLVTIHTLIAKQDINSIFETIKYAELCMNTYYSTKNTSVDSLLFEYYIITNDCVITFNEDYNQGLVCIDPIIINYYIKNFVNIKEKFTPVVKFYYDEIELMQRLDADPSFSNTKFSLEGYFCCGILFDYDILNEIAADNLSNKDYLINTLLYHYSTQSSTFSSYFTPSSIRNFARTGDIKFISDKYVKICTPEQRAYMLNRMLTQIQSLSSSSDATVPKYNYIIKILNDNALNFPSDIALHTFETKIEADGSFDWSGLNTDRHLPFCWEFNYNSPSLVNLFKSFEDYLVRAHYIHNEEFSIRLLKECILQCSMNIPDGYTKKEK